ncbi:unnamed protein product, partial [Aureobasidium mustum]
IAPLSEVRGAEFLPFAVYNLAGIPEHDSDGLVAVINKDNIIGNEPHEIFLAQRAAELETQQQTLSGIVDVHIHYCTTQADKLEYFPFGFLAAHDEDWKANGVSLVYVDFEEPYEVTGFRISIENVAMAANTLRDDDNGAKEVRDLYEMGGSLSPQQTTRYTLHLISPMTVSSPAAQDIIFGARMDEVTRLERERLKLPPVLPRFKPDTLLPEDATECAVTQQRMRKWLADERTKSLANPDVPNILSTAKQIVPKPDVDAVMQVVQEAGYNDFGFVLVRLDYSDEDAWTRWNTAFQEYLDRSLEESQGGQSIADKLMTMNVEDEDLNGTGWHGAVFYYNDLCGDDIVPPGLRTNMILVADIKAVNSLLHQTADVEPWIWAVDVHFDWKIGDQPPRGPPPANHYPGYMRVALSVVVSEFWPLLKGSCFFVRQLWTPDLGLWRGIGV